MEAGRLSKAWIEEAIQPREGASVVAEAGLRTIETGVGREVDEAGNHGGRRNVSQD